MWERVLPLRSNTFRLLRQLGCETTRPIGRYSVHATVQYVVLVLLHNGVFCNVWLHHKTDFALASFPFIKKKQYYADYDKNYYNFYLFNLLS